MSMIVGPRAPAIDRRTALAGGAMLAGVVLAGGSALAQAAVPPHSGRNDFDFLHGSWRVQHRLFRGGKTIAFDGLSSTRPIAGGLGNLEEAEMRAPKATFYGTALRLFDPKSNLWSIWWADSHNPMLSPPPVVGSFTGGVGTLLATDANDPKSVSRFVWKDITPNSAVWEQSLSSDAGASWTLDWHMDFQRV